MKVNKYVLVGLVVVVLFAVYLTFFTGAKKKMASVAAPLDPQKVAAPQPDVRAREERVQTIQTNLQWERDPFMLPTFVLAKKEAEKQSDKKRAPVKLTAIMEGRKGRIAIIDNEVVSKGDLIAGERVLDIGKDTVTLAQDGSKRVIAMQEPK